MPTGEGPDGESAFSRRLAALKREGSNVLVVGAVPDDLHLSVDRQLLNGSSPQRRRLLVFCGVEPAVGDRLPADAPREEAYLQVIHHALFERSAAGATADGAGGTAPTPPGPNSPTEQTVRGDLGDLGAAIAETTDVFEALTGGLDPAEMRLCLDSLDSLVAEYERSRVTGFLHLLTGRVRRANGLAHYHLHADPDARILGLLEPLFDAVVELRVTDDRAEQRWRLDDVTSGWFPVDGGSAD